MLPKPMEWLFVALTVILVGCGVGTRERGGEDTQENRETESRESLEDRGDRENEDDQQEEKDDDHKGDNEKNERD